MTLNLQTEKCFESSCKSIIFFDVFTVKFEIYWFNKFLPANISSLIQVTIINYCVFTSDMYKGFISLSTNYDAIYSNSIIKVSLGKLRRMTHPELLPWTIKNLPKTQQWKSFWQKLLLFASLCYRFTSSLFNGTKLH